MITQQLLDIVENERGIKMLYCCESGSRAWRFPSQDSDFDARFIYVRPKDDYFSILDVRDVVEYSNDGILDVKGWDIRKALKLFLKSNCALYEWLQSPIVYRAMPDFTSEMRSIIPEYFSPRAGAFHYLGLTNGIYPSIIESENVRLKKYFYALRTLLAGHWIVTYQSCPPMTLDELLETVKDAAIKEIVENLRKQKFYATEATTVPAVKELDNFLGTMYNHLEHEAQKLPKSEINNVDPLNEIFRTMVQRYGE
jgi:predicted nucleotidyltransferase